MAQNAFWQTPIDKAALEKALLEEKAREAEELKPKDGDGLKVNLLIHALKDRPDKGLGAIREARQKEREQLLQKMKEKRQDLINKGNELTISELKKRLDSDETKIAEKRLTKPGKLAKVSKSPFEKRAIGKWLYQRKSFTVRPQAEIALEHCIRIWEERSHKQIEVSNAEISVATKELSFGRLFRPGCLLRKKKVIVLNEKKKGWILFAPCLDPVNTR